MHKYRPVSSSRRFGLKGLNRLLWWIAIIMLCLHMLLGCSTSSSKMYNPCLKSAVTYGDVVECSIQLHEAQ